MELNTLQDLLIDHLKDLYSAESQIVEALPKMEKAATAPELKKAFRKHLGETKAQAQRLEEICQQLDVSPRGKKCKGMEGLLEEGQELIKEEPAPEVLDAGLIAAAQKVEHYEISGYGTARTYAALLGHDDIAETLQLSLDEESATDEALTTLAESTINVSATMN